MLLLASNFLFNPKYNQTTDLPIFNIVSYLSNFHQLLHFPVITPSPILCACIKYGSVIFYPNCIFENSLFSFLCTKPLEVVLYHILDVGLLHSLGLSGERYEPESNNKNLEDCWDTVDYWVTLGIVHDCRLRRNGCLRTFIKTRQRWCLRMELTLAGIAHRSLVLRQIVCRSWITWSSSVTLG